jgi:hypothetical protein
VANIAASLGPDVLCARPATRPEILLFGWALPVSA